MTVDQALKKVFPDADSITAEKAYLTDAQRAEARRRAGDGVVIDSALVSYYRATRAGVLQGTAYLDTHQVRTKNESVLVVVTPAGAVERIEILSFLEPRDYLAPEAWRKQFGGKKLDAALGLKGEIRGITGATLTAHALTAAIRRVLALHAVIVPAVAPRPAPAAAADVPAEAAP